MKLAALIVSVIAAVLALVSLGWQFLSFVLSGPRVHVSIAEGFRAVNGGVLVTTPSAIVGGINKLRELGYTEHVILVRVENYGRMAATVERWILRFGNRAMYVHPAADPMNVPVPARVEPQSSVTWHTPVEWLAGYQQNFSKQTRRAKRIRAEVSVGGLRRDVVSGWRLRIDASGVHEHGRWVVRHVGKWSRIIGAKLRA
jgi:hypothetical protein